MKHKRKKIKLKDLIVSLMIKKDNRSAEKKATENSIIMGANIIDTAPTNSKKRKKPSRPKKLLSKKKFKKNCYNYDKFVTCLQNVILQ